MEQWFMTKTRVGETALKCRNADLDWSTPTPPLFSSMIQLAKQASTNARPNILAWLVRLTIVQNWLQKA